MSVSAVSEAGNPAREIAKLWDGRLSNRSRLSPCSTATTTARHNSPGPLGERRSIRDSRYQSWGAASSVVELKLIGSSRNLRRYRRQPNELIGARQDSMHIK